MTNPIDIDLVKISKSEKETKDILNDIRGSYQNLSTIEIKEEVQEEIAKIAILLQRTEKVISRNSPRKIWWEKIPNIITPDKRRTIQEEAKILINSLELAVSSLLFKDKPNLCFSRSIRIDVERVLCRRENLIFGYLINRFMDAQRSPSTPLKVISGLIFALMNNQSTSATRLPVGSTNGGKANPGITKASVKLMATNKLNEIKGNLQKELGSTQDSLKTFKSDSAKNIKTIIEVLLVISAGTLGSIVSILIRIEDFQDKKYLDRLVPFLIGAFKPIIGASFAAFFFALISSEIVTIPSLSNQIKGEAQKDKRIAFIFALAFVVGFSERIAKDTIGKAEDMIAGERGLEVKQVEESHSTRQVVTFNASLEGEPQVILTESKKNTTLAASNISQGSVKTAQNHQDG